MSGWKGGIRAGKYHYFVHAIVENEKVCLIMSLHQPKISLNFCDKIIGLKKGRIIYNQSAKKTSKYAIDEIYK